MTLPDIIIDTNHERLSNQEGYYGYKYRGFVIAGLKMPSEYRKEKLELYHSQLHELILEYNRLLMIYSGIKYAEDSNAQTDD